MPVSVIVAANCLTAVNGTLFQAVCEAKLASIIKVDLTADVFSYTIDKRALKRAQMSMAN